jgi:hypothetical protein
LSQGEIAVPIALNSQTTGCILDLIATENSPVLSDDRVSQEIDLSLARFGSSVGLERGFAHRRPVLFLLPFAAHGSDTTSH